MKIALVLYKYGVRLDDPCIFSLGFMYISSILKALGHDVTVNNQNIEDPISFDGFDAVLFTGFQEFLPYIIRDAEICREKGVKTILGGALATFKPEEMLNHVDTVIVGEGENVICEAFHAFGIIKGTKPDLDSLPLPDYEGFGVSEYHKRNAVKHIGVLTSRGCPHSCKFCAQTCFTQLRDLSLVFEEIDLYRAKYDLDMMVFNDNTLNLTKKRFMAICDGMKSIRLPWSAAIRVDVFDDEMAQAFKDSNGSYFVVGIESFIQEKLDRMNKRITQEQIYRTLDLLHKHKIGYHGNVLTGLPGETATDIMDEINAVPKGYNVFPVLVQPFIGTEYQTRSITKKQAGLFSDYFTKFATERGMSMYPTI